MTPIVYALVAAAANVAGGLAVARSGGFGLALIEGWVATVVAAAARKRLPAADALAALAEVGYTANRRLLDAECISHDPATGADALDTLPSPVISTTCTYIPGMRSTSHRVQALLSACCALALRPAGFTSRDLRHYLAPQLGKTAEDMTSGQISYDLRRLRAHQIIERIPHSRAYQVTADGLAPDFHRQPRLPVEQEVREEVARAEVPLVVQPGLPPGHHAPEPPRLKWLSPVLGEMELGPDR